MKVSISELREHFEKLAQHAQDCGVDEVEIDEDFYWSIPPERRYLPYEEPGEPTMGQLSDDLTELRAIASGEKEPVNYGFVWLSAILRRIGEKLVG
jgi:hypothetical protein